MLDSMMPSFAFAGESTEKGASAKPRRMLAICNNLGLLPGQFFPTQSGRGYELSPYLQALAEHRDDFTVMSGVSHPDVDAGHPADICFLTAAPHPGSGGFRNTISLDQYIACLLYTSAVAGRDDAPKGGDLHRRPLRGLP